MLHESINTIFQILYSKLITIILTKKNSQSHCILKTIFKLSYIITETNQR